MRLNVLLTICAFVNVAGAQQRGVATVVANTRRPEIAIMANPFHDVSAGLAVQLQDIGGADFIDHNAQAQAARTVLLDPLFAGEEKIYTNIEFVHLLKEKIATQPELANYNFTYFVPEKVKVRGVKNLISNQRIASEILTALNQKCESCSFKIKDLKIPNVESRAEMYGYDIDTTALKITGSFLLPVRAHFESQEKTLYVTGTLQTKAKAFVTTKNMAMGEKLESADLRNEEIEIAFASDAFANEQDFIGRVLNKGVSLGRPIYKSDLKKEIVVSRGQMIRVLSGNEMFEVSSQMQAEESGAVGDYVKLKNTETQKMLSGQVVERGLVRVQ